MGNWKEKQWVQGCQHKHNGNGLSFELRLSPTSKTSDATLELNYLIKLQ